MRGEGGVSGNLEALKLKIFESLNSYFVSLNSYFQSLNSYFQSLNSYFQSLNSYFETVAHTGGGGGGGRVPNNGTKYHNLCCLGASGTRKHPIYKHIKLLSHYSNISNNEFDIPSIIFQRFAYLKPTPKAYMLKILPPPSPPPPPPPIFREVSATDLNDTRHLLLAVVISTS